MDFKEFFGASSEQEWKEKITADLKGGSIDDLVWKSEIGPIDPVLFDYSKKYGRVVPKPNQDDNSWSITASFDCSNPENANQSILDALSGGVNRLHLYNCNATSLSVVLNEVMLDIIDTTIYATTENSQNLNEELKNWSENITLTSPSALDGLKEGADVKLSGNHYTINGDYLADLGLNLDHQLGMILGAAHECFLNLMEQGQLANEAAKNIDFKLGVGNSYFAEIAKIGAMRLLWNTLLNEYGVENGYAIIHAKTSNFNYSNLDIHNNLLRGTTAAMAASIAGAESIEVLPYDYNLTDKFGDGQRLAKNIQLLLQEESYFNQVKDAGAGSYYIEQITDILIEKGWAYFQKIDEVGSFGNAMSLGLISATIEQDINQKKELFANKELKLVGVNVQPNVDEKRMEDSVDANLNKANRLAQFNA